jgi:hypothetical protein
LAYLPLQSSGLAGKENEYKKVEQKHNHENGDKTIEEKELITIPYKDLSPMCEMCLSKDNPSTAADY